MKNKMTALILAGCILGGAAWSASAAEYGGSSGADDISTYSTSRMDNLDIPNITSTSTVYDPDGMVNIEVVYAAPDADGTLKDAEDLCREIAAECVSESNVKAFA